MMTFIAHDASEFCRFAQAAYRADRNDIGHLCSGINAGCQTTVDRFHLMKSLYCEWLALGTFGDVAERRAWLATV